MKAARERLTSSATPEHYTPADFIERVRATLGAIDLDPASSEEANRVVRAARFYTGLGPALTITGTSEDNGLTSPWTCGARPARVFCNPPSTLPGDVRRWWIKAAREREAGNVLGLVFLVFRVDALQSMSLGASEEGALFPQAAWRCEPIRRLKFWKPGAQMLLEGGREIVEGKSAMHGSVVLCMGDERTIERFRQNFSALGPITPPAVDVSYKPPPA